MRKSRFTEGQIIGYDSMNLPTFEGVEGETTYLWMDPDGLKSAAWNAVSADTTVFDAAGRAIKQIVRRGTNLSRRYVIESAYDDDGPRNRLWVSAPGSIDYDMRAVWNDEGRLERLSDHVPGTPVHTDFLYNDHQQLEEVEIGGTKRWEYDYSSFHPPIKTEYVGTTLNHKLGTYMRLDPERLRITEIQYEAGDSIRYLEYDAMDQVKVVTDSAFTDPICHYDEQTGWYCWGPSSSEEVGQVSFAYDAVGNRTDSGADTDTGNRLTDLGAYSFTHDDPGVDRPHSLMTSSETYYYATDPTGSVIGLAEYTGAASVTHRYRYDVWGKPRGSATEAVPNPLRFKARLWDEDTGLADFRSRWYDPDIGRFISEDPIALAGGINVYRFVGNDPVSGWDPFGLDPTDPCDDDYDPDAVMAGRIVGYDESGMPIYELEPLRPCVEAGAPGPPSLAPGPGIGPGGTATVATSPAVGKGGPGVGRSGTPNLEQSAEQPMNDSRRCFVARVHLGAQALLDGATLIGLTAVARVAIQGTVSLAGRELTVAASSRLHRTAVHGGIKRVTGAAPATAWWRAYVPGFATYDQWNVQQAACQ